LRRVRRAVGQTFRSLRVRNYRLYFFGQIVSVSGTWMQSVAQAWLVLQLTGSGVALGGTVALQFLPMLLAGAWGGVIADRFDKRTILIGTQSADAVLALTLAVLTATGAVQLWMVFVLAFLLGLVNLVDMPARQAFVTEMVGAENVANAVSLNSVVVNAGRIVGPAVAGILVATVGIAVCFFVNAASYLAVIGALLAMRRLELLPAPRIPRRRGQLREGLDYAWGDRELRRTLTMVAVVGLLAFNFSVFLPLMTQQVFGSGAATLGALYSLLGLGAVAGGLLVAARGRTDGGLMAAAGIASGAALIAAALMPTLTLELVAVVPLGLATIVFVASANSLLQLRSDPRMRGRVMALYGVLFLGTTPIGSPAVGWLAERAGVREAMVLAGAITLAAAAWVARSVLRDRQPGRVREPAVASGTVVTTISPRGQQSDGVRPRIAAG
jgi:MFS family permease